MDRTQFFNTMKYMRLQPDVVDGRIHFEGGAAVRKALDDLPEVEAEMILSEATRNPDLLDCIQERASIRWADGYSDSLYMAVFCNLKDTGEQRSEELQEPTDWEAELSKYNLPSCGYT